MRILVTAGPTREALDPVRFISNRSSGKMGYALAAQARRLGHDVELISGPVALPPPRGIRVVNIVTADDMLAAVKKMVRRCDVLIMAAAVADWRPKKPATRKLKRASGPPRITWQATPDILKAIAPLKKKSQVFCGFAAETHDLAREAKRKLREKNLDVIAANDVAQNDRGFESDNNALTVFFADGRTLNIPLSSKANCARKLVRALADFWAQKKK